MARRQKPHTPTWGGDPIVGLYRCPDGRWRINATGEKFTCHDERQAIGRFLAWQSRQDQQREALVQIPLSATTTPDDPDAAGAVDFLVRRELGPGRHRAKKDESLVLDIPATADDPMSLLRSIPEKALWGHVGKYLIEQTAYVAEQTGIPELAGLSRFKLPRPPLRIRQVIQSYQKRSNGDAKSKREALAAFDRLVRFANATTLADLTDETLLAFREQVITDPRLTSSGTQSAYFYRIRNVLKIASRDSLDSIQLDEALARCKAKLYPPTCNVDDDPRPISRRNFHKLLTGVQQTEIAPVWRAMLLLGLNCALYMEDICDLKWEMFDLKKKTFLSRRKKRGRCLRAAVLWRETVEALKQLPRRGNGPFLFISPRGTRYNKNTKINDFKDFCEKIGVKGVTFSHLRDGAYTAASHAKKVEDKYARLLAGHKNPGLSDKYVLRHPEIVRPATDAVHRHYFE